METWIIIESIATAVSAFLAVVAICQTIRLHRKQMFLERRQLLLPIWKELKQLNEIDPSNPVWKDVIDAVNLLELLAVAWEGQLIDENIIRRMYSSLYIYTYESIIQCKNPPPNVAKDGKEMLYSSPSTMSLYEILRKEYVDKGRLRNIGE